MKRALEGRTKKKGKKGKQDTGFHQNEASRESGGKQRKLANKITRDLLKDIKNTRERVQSAEEDIERGARKKRKGDRFSL